MPVNCIILVGSFDESQDDEAAAPVCFNRFTFDLSAEHCGDIPSEMYDFSLFTQSCSHVTQLWSFLHNHLTLRIFQPGFLCGDDAQNPDCLNPPLPTNIVVSQRSKRRSRLCRQSMLPPRVAHPTDYPPISTPHLLFPWAECNETINYMTSDLPAYNAHLYKTLRLIQRVWLWAEWLKCKVKGIQTRCFLTLVNYFFASHWPHQQYLLLSTTDS